jgi:hypothetical protein
LLLLSDFNQVGCIAAFDDHGAFTNSGGQGEQNRAWQWPFHVRRRRAGHGVSESVVADDNGGPAGIRFGSSRTAQAGALGRGHAGPDDSRQALDWLNTAIDDGRTDLQDQRALESEIDAWDTSCRIMFMVQISG